MDSDQAPKNLWPNLDPTDDTDGVMVFWIFFANSLDPDQARQSIGLDLETLNAEIQINPEVYHPCKLFVFLKDFFRKKLILKNISRRQINMKNFRACKELNTVTDIAQLGQQLSVKSGWVFLG